MSTTTILEAALNYYREGRTPVPIKPNSKKPEGAEWQETRYGGEAEVIARFTSSTLSSHGVGLLLGGPSNGLVDVDLDCPEAIAVAGDILPLTNRISGRASSPTSHYWYTVQDPEGRVSYTHRGPKDTVVELRGTGGQTVVPPTTHVSGESITWERYGPPGETTWAELHRSVRRVAAAVVLTRAWKDGIRHELSLALAGALLRNDWSVKETEVFIGTIADAARDDDTHGRITNVNTTSKRLAADKAATGIPTLGKFLSDEDKGLVCKWLGLTGESNDKAADPMPLKLQLGLTEPGLADRMFDHDGGSIRLSVEKPNLDSWYVWDGKRWALQSKTSGFLESRVLRVVREDLPKELASFISTGRHKERDEYLSFLRNAESSKYILGSVTAARAVAHSRGLTLREAELDPNPALLNTPDGVVDVQTGKVGPHAPEMMLSRVTEAGLNGGDELLWREFLELAVPDPSTRRYIQLMAGAALYGKRTEEALFVVLGPPGTGKSTFLLSILNALGNQTTNYSTTLPIETLLHNGRSGDDGSKARADLMLLQGVRVAVAMEARDGRRFNGQLIKAITGGDNLTARHLYGGMETFQANSALFLGTNHMPSFVDENGETDAAMEQRLRVLPFETMLDRGDPEGKVKKARLLDPAIGGPAVLRWLIEGCVEYHRMLAARERVEVPESVKLATATEIERHDPFRRFLRERCNLTGSVTLDDFREAYNQWSDTVEDAERADSASLSRRLRSLARDKGLSLRVARVRDGDRQVQRIYGVSLRTPEVGS